MVQNRRYEKVISTQWPEGPWLAVDVISTLYPHSQTLYSVKMLKLKEDERSLNCNRFIHFREEAQDNLVITTVNFDHLDTVRQLYSLFEERVNWIAANTNSGWSFTITMEHLHDLKIYWTFEDSSDALRFKLSF
jgi:hypothetical protein